MTRDREEWIAKIQDDDVARFGLDREAFGRLLRDAMAFADTTW